MSAPWLTPYLERVAFAQVIYVKHNQQTNQKTAVVNCPFCSKNHEHGFSSDAIQWRTPHCGKSNNKDYCFDTSHNPPTRLIFY